MIELVNEDTAQTGAGLLVDARARRRREPPSLEAKAHPPGETAQLECDCGRSDGSPTPSEFVDFDGRPGSDSAQPHVPSSSTLVLERLQLAKLHRPRVARDVVRRPRVRELLEGGLDRPCALVCAPAGYGKTTLLSDWLALSGHRHAWLSLDEADSSLPVFLSHFIAAIRILFPSACDEALQLLQAAPLPPVGSLTVALANDIEGLSARAECADGSRFIIVLDDYHLIRDTGVHDLLSGLLRHPPRPLHLILSTRQDPPLPLHLLRARGDLNEIRMHWLRFNALEIASFMEQAVGEPLDAEAVAILEEQTEGWAAGLRMAALALLSSGDLSGHLAELPALGANRHVIDYLMNEVFTHIPAATQDFLLKTAILDPLSGPLCDAVTGGTDPVWTGQAFLEWLESGNLFTSSLDARGGWFRYHPLFRTLLLNRLERQLRPDERATLHRRASDWLAQHDFADEAIAHALATGDAGAGVKVLAETRHRAMNREHWLKLEQWLGLFPRQIIEAHPELVILEAWIHHHEFRTTDIPERLDCVEHLMKESPPDEESRRRLQSEVDTLRSEACYWVADLGGALDYALRALEGAPVDYDYVRANAWAYYASSRYASGDLRGAIDAIHSGLNEDRFHADVPGTGLLIARCFIYWMAADFPSLKQSADLLLKVSLDLGLLESGAWGHYFLGCYHYQRNELTNAEREFGEVTRNRQDVSYLSLVQSTFGRVSAQQALGAIDQARVLAEMLVNTALDRNRIDVLDDAQAFAAQLALVQGRRSEARKWAAMVDRDVRPALVPTFHFAKVSLASVLLADGTTASLEAASHLLANLRELCEATHNTRFLVEVIALEALLHDARRDQGAALMALERAVALAQPGGMIRVFLDHGPKLAALLYQLASRGLFPEYLDRILAAFAGAGSAEPPSSQRALIEPLSERELQVLALLGERLSNKEIARELNISAMTVKRHTFNIYQKLTVQSRREAVSRAVALGIVPAASSSLGFRKIL